MFCFFAYEFAHHVRHGGCRLGPSFLYQRETLYGQITVLRSWVNVDHVTGPCTIRFAVFQYALSEDIYNGSSMTNYVNRMGLHAFIVDYL